MSARDIILPFMSVLLFVSVLVSVFGLSTFTLLEEESYSPYIAESGLYSYIASAIPEPAKALINDTDVKQIADSIMHEAFAYINGEIDTLNLVISANSSDLRKIAREKAAQFPLCVNGSLPSREMLCRPAGIDIDAVIDELLLMDELQVQSVDLAQYLNADGGLTRVRDSVATYRKAVYICSITSILLAALIIIIGWPGRRRGLLHAGIPIFLAGLALFNAFYFGNAFIENAISSRLPDISDFSVVQLTLDVAHGIYGKFVANSIVTSIVGLILIVCAFVFAREESEQS